MTRLFADRMGCVHRSLVREMVTEDSEIISFAGGLPNPRYFPVHEVALAAEKVLSECGEAALQYSTTEKRWPSCPVRPSMQMEAAATP
jgi:2-aminoadipate transaminase